MIALKLWQIILISQILIMSALSCNNPMNAPSTITDFSGQVPALTSGYFFLEKMTTGEITQKSCIWSI